ncbi:MAG: helix-turn-helix domain-containing protein [Leptolyngbya sp. SIO1D8]|nr:helix-turn-helix domain-containing protein [Leptolyngbya sp. SIO1D8]
MNWKRLTDQAILEELGRRIKKRRIHKKLTQRDVALLSGLNINTVQSIEHGNPVKTLSFIQVMRALKMLDQLDDFLPDTGPSPIAIMKRQQKEVQRVRKPRN